MAEATLSYVSFGRLRSVVLHVCDTPHVIPVQAVMRGRWVDGTERTGCDGCFARWSTQGGIVASERLLAFQVLRNDRAPIVDLNLEPNPAHYDHA